MLELICYGLILVAWLAAVGGGVVRVAGALVGALFGFSVIGPLLLNLASFFLGWEATIGAFPLQLQLSEVGLELAALLGFLVGWKVGAAVAPLVQLVPGVNLVNLTLGSLVGMGLGLLAISLLLSGLMLIVPEWTHGQIADSFMVGQLAYPLSQFALSLAPQIVRHSLVLA